MGIRAPIFVNALVAITYLAGCSAKSGRAPQAPPVAEKRFEVEETDRNKLKSVGCSIESTSISCEEPSIKISEENRLNDLLAYQRRLERQKEAVDEVQKSIEEQIKSGKLSAGQSSQAGQLATQMSAYSSSLTSRLANRELDIGYEKMFLLVIGYKCDGEFKSQNGPKKIDASILFGSKEFSQTFEAKGNGDLRANLKLEANTQTIMWGAADSTDGVARNLRHFVQTDGEFTLKQVSTSAPQLSCFKIRADATRTHITDRPKARRYIKCVTNLSVANPQDKEKPNMTGFSLSFNLSIEDASRVTSLDGSELLKEDKTDFMKDSLYNKAKFGARVVSDKGILKFEFTDRQTDKVLYEVQTSNSTPKISLGLEDKEGNRVQLACEDHTN